MERLFTVVAVIVVNFCCNASFRRNVFFFLSIFHREEEKVMNSPETGTLYVKPLQKPTQNMWNFPARL